MVEVVDKYNSSQGMVEVVNKYNSWQGMGLIGLTIENMDNKSPTKQDIYIL